MKHKAFWAYFFMFVLCGQAQVAFATHSCGALSDKLTEESPKDIEDVKQDLAEFWLKAYDQDYALIKKKLLSNFAANLNALHKKIPEKSLEDLRKEVLSLGHKMREKGLAEEPLEAHAKKEAQTKEEELFHNVLWEHIPLPLKEGSSNLKADYVRLSPDGKRYFVDHGGYVGIHTGLLTSKQSPRGLEAGPPESLKVFGGGESLTALEKLPNRDAYIAVGPSASVFLIDMADSTNITFKSIPIDAKKFNLDATSEYQAFVESAKLSLDGKTLFVGAQRGKAFAYDISDLEHPGPAIPIKSSLFFRGKDVIAAMGTAPDGSKLVLGGRRPAVVDLKNMGKKGLFSLVGIGKKLKAIPLKIPKNADVYASVVDVMPDGKKALLAGQRGQAFIVDIENPKKFAEPIVIDTDDVFADTMISGGRFVASGKKLILVGRNGRIAVVDTSDLTKNLRAEEASYKGAFLEEKDAKDQDITSLDITPDEKFMIVGGGKGKAYMWNIDFVLRR